MQTVVFILSGRKFCGDMAGFKNCAINKSRAFNKCTD